MDLKAIINTNRAVIVEKTAEHIIFGATFSSDKMSVPAKEMIPGEADNVVLIPLKCFIEAGMNPCQLSPAYEGITAAACPEPQEA